MTAFGGATKTGKSLLHAPEQKFIKWAIPKLPKFLMSHHLTYMTLAWSGLTIAFGFLADNDLVWIHGISVMALMQWLTDSLDGSLGKYRKQGLVRWGFFMDHILDFVFGGSIVIAYALFAPPEFEFLLLLLLLATGTIMASSFLSFASSNSFQVAFFGIGPTEVRIVYVAMNTFVWLFGTNVFWWGIPLVLAVNLVASIVLIARSSKELWHLDKANNVDAN